MWQPTKKKIDRWPTTGDYAAKTPSTGGTRTRSARVVTEESGQVFADLIAAIQEIGPEWVYFDCLELRINEYTDWDGRKRTRRVITLGQQKKRYGGE
jgi:hypothetical protein